MRSLHISSRSRVVVAVVALVAVAVAAARGGSSIPAGPGAVWGFDRVDETRESGSETIADTDSVLDVIGGVGTGLLLVTVAVLVLFGTVGVLASITLQGARRRRRASTPVRAPVAEDSADGTVVVLGAAVRAGVAALDARVGGPPADAVVAAWLVLEDAAAACGTRRAPAETASEFTARVLGEHSVDATALADLRARYQRARFAGRATDADAHAARAALARVEETLAGARA